MDGVVTSAQLETHRVALNGAFKKGLNAVTSVEEALMELVPSTTGTNIYPWLGAFPKFRKWVGERRYQTMKEYEYALKNEPWSVEMTIDVWAWADDTIGTYAGIISGWGRSAKTFRAERVIEALKKGHQLPCYDGQNFFDPNHPYEYKDDAGTHTGVYANMAGDGSANAMYFVDLSQPLKPILFQNREEPSFWMQTNAQSEYIQMNKKVPLHADARCAAGYTLWQLAYRLTSPLTATTYKAACDFAASLKDEFGNPLGIRYTHIVYGNSNKVAVKTLFLKEKVDGGDDNIYYKDIETLESKWLD